MPILEPVYDASAVGRPRTEDRSIVREKVVPPIRVTADELDTLRRAAEREGATLGVWLRELGLKRARRVLKRT